MKKHSYTIIFLITIFNLVVFGQKTKGLESVQFQSHTILTGQDASSFGMNTKNIGDFNGDGFDDLAVTAERENTSAGAVYIYFGGENSDADADLIFRGTEEWEGLGISVSGAGDFNGDGFDDIMIATSAYPGTVNLYYGGPNYDTNPDVSFSDSYISVGFGIPMTKLGDINGDGFDDVAISNGTINIYLGQSASEYDLMPDYQINGYGGIVAYCGDVNGDGFEDVLTGDGGNKTVYIFGGSENFDTDYDVFLQETTYSGFGNSVAGGGDINNDGFSDIVIGAGGESVNGLSSVGKVYVAFGSPQIFDGSYTFGYPTNYSFAGTNENEYFGHSVAIIKDMNGDGFDEIGVGENFGYFSSEQNKVFIYNGGNQINSAPSNVFNSTDKGYLAFRDITSIDFNADGYSEIVAGDYSFSKAYLFQNDFNADPLFEDVDIALNGINGLDGSSDISGDFNGDGYNDLVESNGGLLLNNNGLFDTPPISSISGKFVGDVNGDGFDDIISSTFLGSSVDIYWGNSEGNISHDNLLSIDTLVLGLYGWGDFNHDGFNDVVISGSAGGIFGESYDGHLFVFYGGRNISNTPDLVLGNSGMDIKSAAAYDINGDNYDDLIINLKDGNGDYHNKIYWGGAAGLFDSYNYINQFEGLSLSFWQSGDFNADGYEDFQIYDNGSGKYYLVFGNNDRSSSSNYEMIEQFSLMQDVSDINADGVADAIFNDQVVYGGVNFPNGEFSSINHGAGVISSGDINNDGLNDLLVLHYINSEDYSFGIVLNLHYAIDFKKVT